MACGPAATQRGVGDDRFTRGRRSALICMSMLWLHGSWAQEKAQAVQPYESTRRLDAPQIETSRGNWDIGLFYPVQFYTTRNALGSSTSFTGAGFGVIAARTLYQGLGVMGSYQVDINAVTSGSIFTGANLGLQYVVFGRDSFDLSSPGYNVTRHPVHRGVVAAGIGQRNFDFRSLVSDEEVLLASQRGQTIELEGSTWAPFVRLQINSRVFEFARLGAFVQYQRTLQNRVIKTQIQSYFVGLTYDFVQLKGVD
jgi:hypothetical protein